MNEKATEVESCCAFHPPTTVGPAKCPECDAPSRPVGRITLGALLKPESRLQIPKEAEFRFCRTPSCDVVYFQQGKILFRKADLAVRVGLKEPNGSTVPVCYCFGWTPQKIRAEIDGEGKSEAVQQITELVKAENPKRIKTSGPMQQIEAVIADIIPRFLDFILLVLAFSF